MPQQSAGLALYRRAHESLLQQYLELEREHIAAGDIEERLIAVAEQMVREHNTTAIIAGRSQLDEDDRQEFLANVRGMLGGGSLAPLLDRADVENIHILGHDSVILSLADGSRIPGPPLAASEQELVMMVRHLAATAGQTSRRFDTASPILDLRLASGHRLFAITSVTERTSVVIRRHRMLQSSLDLLEQSGTLTPPMTAVLKAAVHPPNPANLLVVGGTGAGKTTLLRSLLSEVPQSELLVTIEDTLELHLRSSGLHDRTLALETRTSNTEGTGEVTMYDLAKAALRMSPDRVMVGEVRGGEVMQLLQAMGIGNDGSMGTIHAGSTRAAINKMLIYAQRSPDAPTPDAVLREIAEVLHLLLFIQKLPDGRRAVTSIREVTGYEDGRVLTEEVFAPGPDGVGVYVRPFHPDGEALARLLASGFDPEVLGKPLGQSPSGSAQPRPEPVVELQPRPVRPQPAYSPPPRAPARSVPRQVPGAVQPRTLHPVPALQSRPAPAPGGRPALEEHVEVGPVTGPRPAPAPVGRPAYGSQPTSRSGPQPTARPGPQPAARPGPLSRPPRPSQRPASQPQPQTQPSNSRPPGYGPRPGAPPGSGPLPAAEPGHRPPPDAREEHPMRPAVEAGYGPPPAAEAGYGPRHDARPSSAAQQPGARSGPAPPPGAPRPLGPDAPVPASGSDARAPFDPPPKRPGSPGPPDRR